MGRALSLPKATGNAIAALCATGPVQPPGCSHRATGLRSCAPGAGLTWDTSQALGETLFIGRSRVSVLFWAQGSLHGLRQALAPCARRRSGLTLPARLG